MKPGNRIRRRLLSEVSRKFTSDIFPRSLPRLSRLPHPHHGCTSHRYALHPPRCPQSEADPAPPSLSLLLAPHISESTLETVVVQSCSNSRKTSVSNNVMSSNQHVERVRLISNSLSPGLIPDNPRLHRPSQDPLRYFSSQRSSNLRCEGGRVRIWVVSIPERFGRVQVLSRMR